MTRFSPQMHAALFLVFVIVGGGLGYALHDSRADDAFITFRYGQNIVRGNGPVFTPGERTLGTTSPGEMLLSAAVYAFAGLEGTPTVMAVLGVLAWLAQVLVIFLLVRTVFNDLTALVAALALLLGLAGSYSWVSLETHHAVTLNLAGLLLAVRGRWNIAALLAALAVLFRPDAALLAVPLAMVCVYRTGSKALVPALVFVATLLPWFAFAWSYYGSPLPLTASTKFHNVSLATYAVHIAQTIGHAIVPEQIAVSILVVVFGVYGAVQLARRGGPMVLLAAFPFVHFAAYLYLRPYVEHTWHLYPAVAVLVVLAMLGASDLFTRARGVGRLVVGAVVVGLLVAGAAQSVERIAHHGDAYWAGARDKVYRKIAAFLRQHGDQERERFAAVEVGTLAYYSDFAVMDLGCLVTSAGDYEFRWVIVDPLFRHKVPKGAKAVFGAEHGGFRADVFDTHYIGATKGGFGSVKAGARCINARGSPHPKDRH